MDRVMAQSQLQEVQDLKRLMDCLRVVDTATCEARVHPLATEIIGLANEYLTIGDEVDSYRNILQRAGFPVYPGEVDRFGWLTAYFSLRSGILLFG
jgi:hypothetical protein